MLVHVEIINMYFKKYIYSLSRQGEACKDKIYAGKTPRSVRLRGVLRQAVLVSAAADTAQR